MADRNKPPASSPGSPPSYTVLARRYRSRDFDELIGQEPISLTLQNAIKTNRTAHAYLFTGTRGVGKTSMARIFAKALNATSDLKEKDAISQAILRGDDLDVIEIDGASYRGINEAKELIAGAGLSPARSPYKIYIIDEVHQLTRDAFNALLKTMEEPPAHVKFILCTTEPQKVPATIQSRCQRFDFRMIPTSRIAEQLKKVLADEGVSADEEVVAQVARLGQGSMRDALSILDRLLAGSGQALTMACLEQILGLPDRTLVVELVEAIACSDAPAALDRGAQILANGASVEQALELLTDHLRDLMIVSTCGAEADFLDLSDEGRRIATEQAAKFDPPALVHMIALCDSVARNARNSPSARALFDAALVRLSQSQRFADIASLLGGRPPAPPVAVARPSMPSPPPADSKKKGDSRLVRPAAEAAPSRGSEPHASQPGAAATAELKPASDDQLWPRVLEVASGSIGDRMRTEHLVFQSFDGRTLRLSIDQAGADIARYLSQETQRIADLVKRATGRSVQVELDAAALKRAEGSEPPAERAIDRARRLPLVQKAAQMFDASIEAVEDHAAPGRASNPPDAALQ